MKMLVGVGAKVSPRPASSLDAALTVSLKFPSRETIIKTVLTHVPEAKQDILCDFLIRLYAVYVDLHCKPSSVIVLGSSLSLCSRLPRNQSSCLP